MPDDLDSYPIGQHLFDQDYSTVRWQPGLKAVLLLRWLNYSEDFMAIAAFISVQLSLTRSFDLTLRST